MNERIFLEPHAHTKEGSKCGWMPAAALIEALRAHDYGAVVITDHYLPGERNSMSKRETFLDGFRAAKKAGDEQDVVVLPGMEIRFKDHVEDYLVYGMQEEDFPALPDDACEMGLSSFHELAQEKGWKIYQAHPFRSKHLPANPSFIDGIEIFNGNPRHHSQNRLAANFATLHNLHTIAGSDAHRPGDVGIVGLMVPSDALTPQGFARWLGNTAHPRIQYQEAPMDGIRYLVEAVPGDTFLASLYGDAGWTSYTENMAESLKGIRNSDRIVTAWDDTALIGMARAITDGHTILYVQDILVLSTYHRRGIGKELMRRLLQPYRNIRQTVLITDDSRQTQAFYKACGFENVAEFGCVGYIRLK